jgi:hypothetical protein
MTGSVRVRRRRKSFPAAAAAARPRPLGCLRLQPPPTPLSVLPRTAVTAGCLPPGPATSRWVLERAERRWGVLVNAS